MFKKRMTEAFLTSDAIVFGMILSELKKKNIKFQTKNSPMGTQTRRRGAFFSDLGENKDLAIMYYIYSYKEDVESIKDIAYKILRQINDP